MRRPSLSSSSRSTCDPSAAKVSRCYGFISLRSLSPSGYPPADAPFREFFQSLTEESVKPDAKGLVTARCTAFLTALFMVTLDTIERQFPCASTREEVASRLREYLEEDMKYTGHGRNRDKYANEVVQKAKKLVRT
jgi:hypothetical protein